MRFLPQGETLRVLAPAKINLALEILGRRPDGYHDLRTTMLSVRRYDELSFIPNAGEEVLLRVLPSSPNFVDVPTDDRNLIIKAARLLQSKTGCRKGVAITLRKQIPSQAGLGGGSSDAAATLVGLNRFWKLGLSSSDLHPLAAQLGSDINFFIDSPVAAVCTGRGEQVEEVCLPSGIPIVLIKPSTGLSTGDVFREWSRPSPPSDNILKENEKVTWKGITFGFGNDLEAPARRLNPQIDRVLKTLKAESVPSAMTGSGSACFAICRSTRQAQAIARRCQQRRLGQSIVVHSGV